MQKEVSQGIMSFSAQSGALKFFLIAVCNFVSGLLVLSENFGFLFGVFAITICIIGLLIGCWSGSLLMAKITISNERLVLEHAIKMPIEEKHIQFWQLGRHHLDAKWEEIDEVIADSDWIRIHLNNGECYVFPIGWCKGNAKDEVASHKPIKPMR